MAVIESKFFSKELFRSVCVNIVLPLPDSGDYFFETSTNYPKEGEKYPVLYLLHGLTADHSDWARFSGIERYAQKKKIAVVMPGVDNSFYKNLRFGGNYYNYYTKELPEVMESLFPISGKRENKYIAGLSMGGYGAFKAAFLNPGKYAYAGSLSGGLFIEGYQNFEGGVIPKKVPGDKWLRGVFGANNEYFIPEEDSLRIAAKNLKDEGHQCPELYMACGREDFLYESNIEFRNYIEALGLSIKYEEGPGVHDWDFWDPFIRKFIEFLPDTEEFVS